MESWSGRRYARAVGWRIGLFLAFTVGLPSLLVLGNRSGGCGRGSVCEAGWFFVGFGILLWPLVILVFAAVLAGPTIRRSRSLGLPWMCGVAVPALLLADGHLFMVMLARTANPSIIGAPGAVWGQLPVHAAAALLTIVLLAVAESREAGGPLRRRYGVAGPVAAVLLLALSANAVCWVALQITAAHNATRNLAHVAAKILFELAGPAQIVGVATAIGLCALIGIEIRRRFARSGRTPAAPA